jgi:hypothetical protein
MKRAAVAVAGTMLASTLVVAGSAASNSNAPGISPTTQFTPVTAQVLTTPQAVKASDGKYHVAYELVLTNATAFEVDLKTVEVRDADTSQVVLSLTGAALSAQLNPIGMSAEDDTAADDPMPSSGTAVVWLDVVVPTKNAVPRQVDHRVAGTIAAPAGARPFSSVVSPLTLDGDTPIVLAPPVPSGKWLMSEGCCIDFTHHRHGIAPINGELLVPQRFAIDYYLLDDQDRTWIGDPKDLHSYLSYEKPTLASADGVVVVASDGRPDQHPPKPPPIPPIEDTVGNHVIIKVSDGVYLLYAHMKPGSIVVHVGQRVKVGQQIGLIGTTGNSTTPHLHFQVLTTPTFFPADSPPYVFDQFELVGHETKRIWDDNIGLQKTGKLPIGPATDPGPRQNAMPLDRDVVVFSTRQRS